MSQFNQRCVSFIEAIKNQYRNYADLAGRASRSEYWWWSLYVFIIIMLLMVICMVMSIGTSLISFQGVSGPAISLPLIIVGMIMLAVIVIPSWALCVRRLHDIGLSSMVVWVYFVYWLGYIICTFTDMNMGLGLLFTIPYFILSLFIFICSFRGSQQGSNSYGDVPNLYNDEGVRLTNMLGEPVEGKESELAPAAEPGAMYPAQPQPAYPPQPMVAFGAGRSDVTRPGRWKKVAILSGGAVLVVVGIVIAVIVSLRGLFSSGSAPEVEYYPVMVEEDGGWNLIDSEGNLLLARDRDEYISPVINGVFVAAAGEGLAVVTAESVPKVIARDLVCAGYLGCGVIPVTRKGERISIIDKKGKRVAVLDPIDGREIAGADNMFIDGLLKVYDEDYKCAFVDTEGKVIIPFKYDYVSDFSDGYAFAYTDISDEVRSVKIIDNKGEELCTLEQGVEPTGEFCHGLVPASQNNRAGYVDTDGKFTPMPVSVQYLSNYDGECFVFYDEEGKVGLINRAGKKMVPAKYISLTPIGNGKYLARRDIDDQSSWSIINGKGEILVNIGQYEFIMHLPGKGFCLVASGEKYSKLLNSKGKQVGTTEFYILDSSLRSEEEGTPIYSEWPGVGFRYE